MPDQLLPKKLEQWLSQPGTILTQADCDFIAAVHRCAARGVGYGFMQQVIEWIWQEVCEQKGLPGGAWGPEYFLAAELAAAEREREDILKLIGVEQDEYRKDRDECDKRGNSRGGTHSSVGMLACDRFIELIRARGRSVADAGEPGAGE